MAIAEELVVQIRAEVDRAVREIKKVDKQLDKTTKAGEKTATGMQNLGKALAVVGGAAIAAKVARELVNLTKESLNLAGAAAEVESKFRVVFGDEAADVREWADEFTSSIGRSEVATLGFLSSIQDTLVPLGLSRSAAANMSREVVSLATDLGSFNNVATDDVIRDFQSALVGNTETLRKYGIVANQAQIEQFALSEGLIQTGETLGPLEKAQAIYGIAVQSSSDAMGDAVRTADSFVNTKRSLEDAVNDLKIAFGGLADDGVARAQSRLAAFVTDLAEVVDTKNIVGDVLDEVAAGDIAGIPLDELRRARSMIQEEGGALQQAYENIILGNQRDQLLGTIDEEIRLREQEARIADGMAQTERDRAGTTQYITAQTRQEAAEREAILTIQRAIESGLISELRGIEEKKKLRQEEIDQLEEAAIKTGTLNDTQIARLNELRSTVSRYDARIAQLTATEEDHSDAVDEVYGSYNAFLTNGQLAAAAENANAELASMTTELRIMNGIIGTMPTLPFDDSVPASVEQTRNYWQELNEAIENRQLGAWIADLGTTEEKAKALQAAFEGFGEYVGGPLSAALNSIGDLQKNRFNAEIAQLEQVRDRYEKNSQAYREAQEDINEAKKEQFRKEKAAAISMALVNGALAVTKALAELGPIAGGIAAGVIAAATAVQVGTIASQQVPLAQGGIVTGPTNALIGEAGPEAVIPLDRMGGMGGTTIVNAPQITVQGSMIHERELIRYITGGQRRMSRGY